MVADERKTVKDLELSTTRNNIFFCIVMFIEVKQIIEKCNVRWRLGSVHQLLIAWKQIYTLLQ